MTDTLASERITAEREYREAADELEDALNRLLAPAEMTKFSDEFPLECELAHTALARFQKAKEAMGNE